MPQITGFAQKRRRTFIYATKNNTSYYNSIKDKSFEDIIHRDGFFAKEFKIENNTKGISKDFQYKDIYDVSDNFKMTFENAGIMKDGKIYTEKVEPKYIEPTKLGEVLEEDADKKYYVVGNIDKWEYLKGPKKIERTSKTGFKYMFSEGGMLFPDALDKPARTMLTSESSVNRSSHIIEDPKKKELRILTPVEAERINGFDDNWTNTGMPEKFRYFCMGNALVVGLIEKMGNRLDEIFTEEGK